MSPKTKSPSIDGLHRGDIDIIRLCSLGAAQTANLMAAYTGNNEKSENEFDREKTQYYLSDMIDTIVEKKNIGLLPKEFEDMSRVPFLPLHEPLSLNGDYSRQIGLLVANTAFAVATSAPPDIPRYHVGAQIITESAAALGHYMGQSMGIKFDALPPLTSDIKRLAWLAIAKPETVEKLDAVLDFIRESGKIPDKISQKMDGKVHDRAYNFSVVSGLGLARTVLDLTSNPQSVHGLEETSSSAPSIDRSKVRGSWTDFNPKWTM